MTDTTQVCRLEIAGMTCAACETKVARQLAAVDGVVRADVSARTGRATLQLSHPVADDDLAAAVQRAGYRLATGPRPWFTREREVWRDVAIGVGLVLLVGLVISATGVMGTADKIAQAASGGSLILVVLLGVAASVSSCMALTGGLLVSLSARFALTHPQATTGQRLRPQVMFNVGRVAGFAALGAGLGALGSLVTFTPVLTAVLMIVVAVVMSTLGIALSGLSPRLAGIALRLPGRSGSWAEGQVDVADDGARPYRDVHAIGWGAASFFLPCGFTQAVQVYAAATGRPLQAALIMALFALGTAPGLLAAGSLASLARGPKARHVYRVLGVVVIAFAIVNLSGAITTLLPGSAAVSGEAGGHAGHAMPAASESAGAGHLAPAMSAGPMGSNPAAADPAATDSISENVTMADGVQRVRTEHNADGYVPAVTTIKAGVPVEWTVTSSVTNCGSTMNLSSLGLGSKQLALGENTIEFTPDQAGDLPYTCSMGMMKASFHVIP